MSLVYDRHEEDLKSLKDLLKNNKMNFTQFLRTVNFVRGMSQEELNIYIDAYQNDELNNFGWY